MDPRRKKAGTGRKAPARSVGKRAATGKDKAGDKKPGGKRPKKKGGTALVQEPVGRLVPPGKVPKRLSGSGAKKTPVPARLSGPGGGVRGEPEKSQPRGTVAKREAKKAKASSGTLGRTEIRGGRKAEEERIAPKRPAGRVAKGRPAAQRTEPREKAARKTTRAGAVSRKPGPITPTKVSAARKAAPAKQKPTEAREPVKGKADVGAITAGVRRPGVKAPSVGALRAGGKGAGGKKRTGVSGRQKAPLSAGVRAEGAVQGKGRKKEPLKSPVGRGGKPPGLKTSPAALPGMRKAPAGFRRVSPAAEPAAFVRNDIPPKALPVKAETEEPAGGRVFERPAGVARTEEVPGHEPELGGEKEGPGLKIFLPESPPAVPTGVSGQTGAVPVERGEQPRQAETPLILFIPEEEEVRGGAFWDGASVDIPEEFRENELILMVVDPDVVFVSWDILPEVADRAARGLFLRTYDVTGVSFNGVNARRFFDIEVEQMTGSRFLDIGMHGRDVIVEFCVMLPDGTFHPIGRSNGVSMPTPLFSGDVRGEPGSVLAVSDEGVPVGYEGSAGSRTCG